MGGGPGRDEGTVKIVVDTSIWIDFFNGVDNLEARRLKELIEEDQPIHLLPIIIQEILQGIRDDRHFETILNLLDGFPVILLDLLETAIGAATLYRSLRKKGLTIRKSNDCLIAHSCIQTDSFIMFKDRDFVLMANATELKKFF